MRVPSFLAVFVLCSTLGLAAADGEDSYQTRCALCHGGDGAGTDLGYPSTVQLDDGSLVTVWYEKFAGSTLAVLRQATWRI